MPLRSQDSIRVGSSLVRASLPWLLVAAFAASAGSLSAASFYRPGDVVENFSLVNRATRQPVQLKELEGKIIFLEWFAWWCPYCQASAPQVEAGIVEWYASRGGNPSGIPVVHVAVNLQPSQEAQTQNFINRAGFQFVLEDFNRALANRFQSGGQPIFAIINGVAGSPTHRPWELLAHQDGYGQRDFSESLLGFRAAIDAVKSPPPIVAPRVTRQPAGGEWVEGETVSMSVAVEGTEPLTYAWFKDDERIQDATGPTLEIPKVTVDATGQYKAEIANAAGHVVSDTVSVVVRARLLPAPTIAGVRPSGSGMLAITVLGAGGCLAGLGGFGGSASLATHCQSDTGPRLPRDVMVPIDQGSSAFYRAGNR
jgi:thiol-disulfide isomerase/thioredoxin